MVTEVQGPVWSYEQEGSERGGGVPGQAGWRKSGGLRREVGRDGTFGQPEVRRHKRRQGRGGREGEGQRGSGGRDRMRGQDRQGGQTGVLVAAWRTDRRRGGGRKPTEGLSPSGPSLPDSASPSAPTQGWGQRARRPPGHLQVIAVGAVSGVCLPQALLTGPTSVSAANAPVSAI